MPATTILVVDDEPVVLWLCTAVLQAAGYTTQTATDGWEAWTQAQQQPPAAILMDIMMPRLDGIAVCERLRSNPATATVPIVLMSAAADRFPAAYQAGATCVVAKPFDPSDLVSLLANILTTAIH